MEEDFRNRKEHRTQNTTEETTEGAPIPEEDTTTQTNQEAIPSDYDIESDPDYKWIFVGFKIVIVILGYIAFQICFDTFIRPLFISVDERIGMIIASLQEQWCTDATCTPEEQNTIESIVKNIKESGKRFW